MTDPPATDPASPARDEQADLCCRLRRLADPHRRRLVLARIDALLAARRQRPAPPDLQR